jgi:hypothetical protein
MLDLAHDLHAVDRDAQHPAVGAVAVADHRARGQHHAVEAALGDDFDIGHATLQPEPPEYRELACETCDALPLDDHAH